LLPLFDDGLVPMPDEGLYSAQAAYLSEGSWEGDRPAVDVDPHGELVPLFIDAVVGDRHIPYYRHPLYPAVLAGFYRVAGTTGLVLASVIGTWLAAVSAARLARRLDPRLTLPTLWLCGAGSPLLYYAYAVIGHAPAAGA